MRATLVFALCLLTFCKAAVVQNQGFLWFWFDKGDANSDGLISAVEFTDWKSQMRDCHGLQKGILSAFVQEVNQYGKVSKTKYENEVTLHYAGKPDCLVPGEIDTYFTLMDVDHDENLSFQEIEFGYAKFRIQTHYVLKLFAAIDTHASRARVISSKLEGDGIQLEDLKTYIQTETPGLLALLEH